MEKRVSTMGIKWMGEMTRVSLKPGDTLVVMLNSHVPLNVVERMTNMMQSRFPEQKIMVLEEGATIGVLSQGERE